MKTLKGTVVSVKMLNTVVVEVVSSRPHPLYKKLQKRSKKYKADTAQNNVGVGDMVEISQIPPMSKDKYFKIATIVKKMEDK